MKAYGKALIISELKEEVKTKIGIVLPSTKEIRYKLGEVVGIGDVKDIKVGDKIYYDKMGESEIRIDGKKLFVIMENDVRVIL